jgi:hypothetical protein
MKVPLKSFQFKIELSILIRTRVTSILVNQNKGKFEENFKFQNALLLQIMDT